MKTRLLIPFFAASLFATSACDKPTEPTAEPAETAAQEAPKEEPAAVAQEDKPAEEAAVATIGQPAPDFELPDEAGKMHKLSDLKGKIVVLEWTSPECPVVRRVYDDGTMTAAYMTATKTKPDENKEAAPEVVWLAVDSSNFAKPEDSTKWKTEAKIEYPQLQDPSGAVGKVYAAKTTPHMYVVDAEGVLRYSGAIDNNPHGKLEGEDVQNYVSTAISDIMNGRKIEKTETKPYGCSVKYGS